MRKTVALGFDDAVARTRDLLQAEGFGVLTEIDMQAKLKEKIGAEIQRYLILGACNPPLAHKAVQAEPEIGLLLPCNVIVYEAKDGKTIVSAMDPDVMVKVVPDNPTLREVAKDARARLERAIAKL
ncbi:MAG TPA: DUF302 domain-containing protein [Thermoanaerobaculia bacterium]